MKKLTLQISLLLLVQLFVFNQGIQAQNSGPISPEATSFEPVDATDMVNLVTGDFSYVIPILEIPSPEGGFPIALSYHGGITMDQEASWVGLGWNINPGAINRTVNGNPDDWKNRSKPHIIYNHGGTKDYYSASFGINITDVVSIGLNYSWGDQKTMSGSISLGPVSIKSGQSGFSVGLNINESLMHTNVSVGSEGVNASIGASIGFNGRIGNKNKVHRNIGGSLGISFSSIDGYGANASLLGASFVSSGAVGKVSYRTITNTWVPYLFGSYRHKKVRYWTYVVEGVSNFGTIYTKDSRRINTGIPEITAFPMDVNFFGERVNQIDSKYKYNALPAYDNYQVNAQGLGGSITPRIFEAGTLKGKDNTIPGEGNPGNDGFEKSSTKEVTYFSGSSEPESNNEINSIFDTDASEIYFDFNYANSSYLRVLPLDWEDMSDGSFKPNLGGALDKENLLGQTSYIESKKRRKTGKYIEWITNYDIWNNEKLTERGFLEPKGIPNEDREASTWNPCCPVGPDNWWLEKYFDNYGIGAILITTEDGKTYHYSIPVYQFEGEYIDESGVNFENFFIRKTRDKYAYTWLLTAITGPDFIDVNSNGKIDKDDYGYWVQFNYGKWTDGFIWQSPYNDYNEYIIEAEEDYEEDIDHRAYSWGRKQIYYLNSIETRTHVAYFVKNLRKDGLGKDKMGIEHFPTNAVHKSWKDFEIPEKHPALRLEKIILIKKDNDQLLSNSSSDTKLINPSDIPKVKIAYIQENSTENMCFYNKYGGPCFRSIIDKSPDSWGDPLNETTDIYLQDQILDVHDIPNGFEENALKVIEFNYDYSLCGNTPNSEASGGGKLTLNSLEIYGKNGFKVVPDYNFDYYDGSDITGSNGSFSLDRKDVWGFDKGDGNENSGKSGAKMWSLKEIETPIGAKLKIDYESDSYYREAAYSDNDTYSITNLIEIEPNYYWAEFDFEIDNNNFILNKVYSYYCKSNGRVSVEVVKIENTRIKLFYSSPRYLTKGIIDGETRILYGGGVRTTQIELIDELDNRYKTLYNYNSPENGMTSGVTSYTPYKIGDKPDNSYISELPIPNVMYEYVSMKQVGINDEEVGHIQYKFNVLPLNLDQNLINFPEILSIENVQDELMYEEPTDYNLGFKRRTYARNTIISDNRSILGKISKIEEFNKNNEKTKKTEFIYKPLTDISTGIVQETFKSSKAVRYPNQDNAHRIYFTSTSKILYPTILDQIITTVGGLTTIEKNEKFDFNTGLLLESETILPSGKTIKTVKTPAYTIYNEATEDDINNIGMGSKVDNIYNKNMLTQLAGEKAYHITSDNVKHLLGASVQTWSDDWNYIDPVTGESDISELTPIWRKHKTFSWEGDISDKGYYKDFDETKDFDYSETEDNSLKGWGKVSEITKYNHYSAALEAKDINDKCAATRMDMKEEKVMATAANTDYHSFTYTGFEEEETKDGSTYWGGDISSLGNRIESKANAHTGAFYLELPSIGITIPLTNFEKDRMYRASVWARTNSPASTMLSSTSSNCGVAGDKTCRSISKNDKQAIHMGDWYLLNITFKATIGSSVTISNDGGSGNIYIDDFRLHPIDAPMQSYAYNHQTDMVTAILNNENIATKFEYDEAGRLIETYKETPDSFVRISEHKYIYARTMFECKNVNTYYTGTLSDQLEIRADIENKNEFPVTTDVVFDIDHRTPVVVPTLFLGNEIKLVTAEIGKYIYCESNSGSITLNDNVTCDMFTIPKSNCPPDIVLWSRPVSFDNTSNEVFTFDFRVSNFGCSPGGGDLSVEVQNLDNGEFTSFETNIYSGVPESLTVEPCESPDFVGEIGKAKIPDGIYRLVYSCGAHQIESDQIEIAGGELVEDGAPPPPTLTGVTIVVEGETGDNIDLIVEDGIITCTVLISGGINPSEVDIKWRYAKKSDVQEYPLNIPVPDPLFDDGAIWVTAEYNGIVKEDYVGITYWVEY